MKYHLNPWLLVFSHASTEDDYRRDHFNRIIGSIRIILLAASILFVFAWLFNAYVRALQPDITEHVLIEIDFFNSILAYILVPLCFVLYALSYLTIAVSLYQFAAGLMACLVIFSSAGLVFSSADLTAQHYSFGFLLINTWVIYTVSQLRFLYAALICYAGSFTYIFLLYHRFPDPLLESATYLFLLAVTNLLGPLAAFQIDKTSRQEYINRQIVEERELELAREKKKSEDLLLNVLPESIAQRLKLSAEPIADRFDSVTVLFADIAGFTDRSSAMPADELVGLLDKVFSKFDSIAEHFKLEKIKTIGDAYMVAAGVPEQAPEHATRIAEFSLEMLKVSKSLSWPDGSPLSIRVGINSGPAVAGVIGRQKFIYDLWGDTVNTASRMESHGVIGEVQVAETSYHLLKKDFELVERGMVEVKGKGLMQTWLLKGRK